MRGRTLAATVLLLVVGAGLWWLAAREPAMAPPSGSFDVYVVGPSALLHDGTVEVDGATELAVLQALARREGFAVDVDDLPGCAMDYVRGIAGHGETATGGWNFYLRRDAGWQWQSRSAACPGLRAGDDVLWCWVEPDEHCAFMP